MKHGKSKLIFLITMGVLVTSLVGSAGCSENTVVRPEPIELESPPIIITAEQLYAEYMADEAAADAKYKGKKVWFTKVVEIWFYEDEYWDPETQAEVYFSDYSFTEVEPLVYRRVYSPTETYIMIAQNFNNYMIGSVKCVAQDPSQLEDIKSGYVVDIVGECQGLSQAPLGGSVVTVKISRIEIVTSLFVIFGELKGLEKTPSPGFNY